MARRCMVMLRLAGIGGGCGTLRMSLLLMNSSWCGNGCRWLSEGAGSGWA